MKQYRKGTLAQHEKSQCQDNLKSHPDDLLFSFALFFVHLKRILKSIKKLRTISGTTTTNLQGQSTDITASTSGGVLTVTALTTAPVSGDVFVLT